MTLDDLPEGIEQAHVRNATDGTRFHDADGYEWVVLQSARDGSRELVRDDVVDYGRLDHPMLGGVLGLLQLLASLISPVAIAYVLAQPYSPAIGAGILVFGLIGAYVLAQIALYFTPGGDQLFRFLEWREHQYLILSHREGGAA